MNSVDSSAVHDVGGKLSARMQNGRHHTNHSSFISGVDADDGCYSETSASVPFLSDNFAAASDDDAADASEELSSDNDEKGSPVILKLGEETSLRIAFQVFFPYLVAGFGMVGAGAVLEIVKVCGSAVSVESACHLSFWFDLCLPSFTAGILAADFFWKVLCFLKSCNGSPPAVNPNS